MVKEEETIGRVKAYLDVFESEVKNCDFRVISTAFYLGMDRQLMINEFNSFVDALPKGTGTKTRIAFESAIEQFNKSMLNWQ